MRLSIFFAALLLIIAGLSTNSYGQETVKKQGAAEIQRQKLEQRNHYRQILQVDSVKADQISEAQSTYKDSLKAVLADTTLNDGAKRSKIELLMEVKNQKLRRLLNDAQQKQLIPSTERKSATERVPASEITPLRDNQKNR